MLNLQPIKVKSPATHGENKATSSINVMTKSTMKSIGTIASGVIPAEAHLTRTRNVVEPRRKVPVTQLRQLMMNIRLCLKLTV